jgi:hypothetical protein
MNEETTLLLSVLSRNYHFREILVTHWDPVLIETERGMKRLRFWSDERLLRNHINWRKQLSGGAFFVDQMYVTVSGSPFVRFGRYAITCHDAPAESASVQGSEALWSEVVGTLLLKSRGEDRQPAEQPARERLASMIRRMERTSALNPGRGERLLRLCYPEAEARAARCDELRFAQSRSGKTFMLPSDFRLYHSKRLLETLFVEYGQSERVGGYPQLADFFLESMGHEGEAALRQLFMELNRLPHIGRETADLLQASWYEPGEWLSLAEASMRRQLTPEEMNVFEKTWNQKTRIISLFQSVSSGTG